ncbi:MAG: hypothetical protein JNK82_14430 [Myxococcaceae bacterium]|nr:hypothetical protein [Myxococcaceae bacterium]
MKPITEPASLDDLDRQTLAARDRLIEVLDAVDSKRHTLKAAEAPVNGAARVKTYSKKLALPLGVALGGAAALVASLFLKSPKTFFRPWPVARPLAKVLQSVGVSLMSYGLAETVKTGVKLGLR